MNYVRMPYNVGSFLAGVFILTGMLSMFLDEHFIIYSFFSMTYMSMCFFLGFFLAIVKIVAYKT
jgi:hypothetical protein